MTPSAQRFAEVVEKVVDEYAAKLTSHELITALEAVLAGVIEDGQGVL